MVVLSNDFLKIITFNFNKESMRVSKMNKKRPSSLEESGVG